ncbi:MAG: helix-turn-helix domain-containing protein [Thermoleophilia bacterium]|nr:helix-turn-helix domain-containing protein [Thermoleophilia bacterium]
MVDVEYIKKHEEGWSIRKIARRLEVSRQTVRKVLAGPA